LPSIVKHLQLTFHFLFLFDYPLFFFSNLFFNFLDIWVFVIFLFELFLESTLRIFELFKSVY